MNDTLNMIENLKMSYADRVTAPEEKIASRYQIVIDNTTKLDNEMKAVEAAHKTFMKEKGSDIKKLASN